jgi:hypothetical protein
MAVAATAASGQLLRRPDGINGGSGGRLWDGDGGGDCNILFNYKYYLSATVGLLCGNCTTAGAVRRWQWQQLSVQRRRRQTRA